MVITMISKLLLLLPFLISTSTLAAATSGSQSLNATVLILGGGVAGIIAARTLHQQNISFLIVEARDELGGRMQTHNLSGTIVEKGPNWIQGTQDGDGPANPILTLARKWNVKTAENDIYGSVTTYDNTGAVDFLDVFNQSIDDLVTLTVGAGERVNKSLVDTTARTGYSLSLGRKPKTIHEQASEYFQYDWEYGQRPEESSWVASSWNNNFTYDTDQGGFSDDNQMSVDQRGFKTLIQLEAKSFLKQNQVLLNSVVAKIDYSNGQVVKVTLEDGRVLEGAHVLCTFSVGVLQNDDVAFTPELPGYKREAIESMNMVTYTKIFLKFPKKFWFDTEMALYADPERGRYPVWQSLDHEDFFPGSGVVFVTVTGEFSVRIEALPDEQVKSEVLSVLQAMFPHIKPLPAVEDFWFPRWHSDPLFRGSYSNWGASFVSEHHENLRASVGGQSGKVWFAGEATSVKYYGFLHGAYFEGQDVANEIAKCVKNGTCDGLKSVAEAKNEVNYDIGPLVV